jgi:hypothetical protein
MQRALFFQVFFCLVALHSTPHGARRYLQGVETRVYSSIYDTTPRGGGCVVAQGDVVPICLVGGIREGREQNGTGTPKSRKNLKEERVCARDNGHDHAIAIVLRYTFSLFFVSFRSISRYDMSPSPPLPLGYIVVWRRAKKHLYGQSALSGSIVYERLLPSNWALHLHVLLLGARVARTVGSSTLTL